MSFLNPALLWGLVAVAGPLIIHWIHQNRHRTMPWAATLFLQKTQAPSANWARLKQWLLLAVRTLAVAALALAFCRPMTGGWLPSFLEENPECIVLLLDRSGSMEAPVSQEAGEGASVTGSGKRAHALRLWQRAAQHTRAGRWFFWENVLQVPLELSNLDGLESLPQTGRTDTAANLPALLLAAVRHLESQRAGRAEIWIASDMQASNWNVDSPDWESLREKTAAWKGATRVRLLDLSTPRLANTALTLSEIQTRVAASAAAVPKALKVSLKIRLSAQPAQPFEAADRRLLLNLRGAVSTHETAHQASVQTQLLLPPLLPAEAGWGSVQIPADSHLPDNTVYFAWEVPAVLHAVVVDAGASGKLLQLACAPDPDAGRTQARILGPDGLTAAILSTTDLVVWNGGALPAETARLLTPWLREGGIFVQLPPAGASPAQNAPPSPGLSAGDFSPPAWGALERGQTPLDEKNEKNDRGQTPFGITLWEENDGPLARTENGQSLSLASVEIHTRQIPQPSDLWQVLATHGDGKPFLIRQSLGRGSAYALSSGVGEDWSSLGEGTVLVPFVQRLLHKASQQRHPVSMGTAGEWKPDPDEVWIPVHPLSETEPAAGLNAAGLRDPRWRAGVYQNGSRFVALNRPESEDDPGLVPAANVGALLPGVPVQTLENASALSADSLQSELWPAFSTLLAFFLFAEMALCWSDAGSALRTPFSRNVSRKGVAP